MVRIKRKPAKDKSAPDLEGEIWKAIHLSSGYEISNFGRVRCWRPYTHNAKPPNKPRQLRPCPDNGGYLMVQLSTGDGGQIGVRVHRLMLEVFTPNNPGLDACHINGVKTDNRLENLRWDTRSGNLMDKRKHGTSTKRFSEREENYVLFLNDLGARFSDIGAWFDVSGTCAWKAAVDARKRRDGCV